MEGNHEKIVIATIVTLLIGVSGYYYIENSSMELKAETIKLEYGKTISTNAEEYLDLSKVKNKEEFLSKCTVVKPKAIVKGKSYEKIGKYTIEVKRGFITKKCIVVINDTTAPKIKCEKEYTTTVGNKVNLKEKIKASDLSKFEIKIDDKNVNYNNAGKYNVKVTAVDEYGNKTAKSVSIRVKEKKNNTYTYNNTHIENENNQIYTNKSDENKSNSSNKNRNEGEEKVIAIWTEDDNVKCTDTHDGFKPAYGGWTNSYSQLEEWAFEYMMNYDSSISTYGGYFCTKCGMMCISNFS